MTYREILELWEGWLKARKAFWDHFEAHPEDDPALFAWTDSREHFHDWMRDQNLSDDESDRLWKKYYSS